MKRKIGIKITAVLLSLLMTISSSPLTVVWADDKIVTAITSAQSGVTFTADKLAYTINEDESVDYDGNTAEIDVKLAYQGDYSSTLTGVTVNGTDITSTYDSVSETYAYTVEFDGIKAVSINVVWTHSETVSTDPLIVNNVDESETATLSLTEDNVKKYSVKFECGAVSETYKYVPGENYEAHKDEALALLSETPTHSYSYDITWGSKAVDSTTFTATATRKTFGLSSVETEVKLAGDTAGSVNLGSLTASLSLVKSEADSTTIYDKAYVGGVTDFSVSLNSSLYKVYSVEADTNDTVTLSGTNASATFSQKPAKITVYVIFDSSAVSLVTDSNKHFTGANEEISIETSVALPVELEYTVNSSAVSKNSNGLYSVNSAVSNVSVKGVYSYGVSGLDDFELSKALTFINVPFEYTSDVTPVNDNGTFYFKDDAVVISSPAEIVILDKNSNAVSGELNAGIYEYSLGEGVFTSAAFGDVDTIYVDSSAPDVVFENGAVASGEDSASYEAFKTAGNDVSIEVSDNVLGIESVVLTLPDSSTQVITPDAQGKAVFSAAVNGIYKITATDNVLKNTKDYTITVKANDETAPVIDDITAPSTATKAANQSFDITVTEAQSGFDTSDISVTGSAVAVKKDGGTITVTVTDNGSYSISVTDKEGNASASKSFTVDNFDRSAPSAALNLPSGGRNILARIAAIFSKNSEEVKLSLSVTDVAEAGEKTDYIKIKDEKAYYYVYTLSDDDIKADGTVEVSADNEAAVKALMLGEGEGVKSFNPESGNANVDIVFGKYVVFVLAYDLAGNEIFAYSDGLVFDDKAPEITVTYDGKNAVNGSADIVYVNDASNLSASTSDPVTSNQFVSGIQKIVVKVNGVSETQRDLTSQTVLKENDAKGNFAITLPTDDGRYNVEIKVYDMCFNESTFTFTYDLDNNAPTPKDLTYAGGGSWSSSNEVTFKIDDVDSASNTVAFTSDVKYTVSYDGVNETAEYSASADAYGVYKIDESLVLDGDYTMTVRVKGKDVNNNSFDTPLTADIKKDTKAPLTSDFVLSVDSSLLNKLSFGIFGKKTVKVDINVSNTADASAVNETVAPLKDTADVTYKVNGASTVATADKVSETLYTIDLPYTSGEEISYSDFAVLVVDTAENKNSSATAMAVANTSVAPSSDANAAEEIKSVGIMLEANAPSLTEDSRAASNEYTFSGDKYYSGDVALTVGTQDTESGLNHIDITIDDASDTVSYTSEKTNDKKTFVYEPEKGTVKTGTTEVINSGAKAQGDDNLYNITLKTVDNSLNETEKSYKLYVDSLSPRVAPSRANTEAFVNVDKIETVFDVTDSHFFYSSAYGKVTAVVEYNGVNQTLEIGGAVHETSYDEAIKLEYTDSDTVKLTFTKEGKYQLKSLKVEDLLKNETDVDISAVDSAVVIDRNLADITDITIENATLKDKFRVLSIGTFTQDSVKVTVNINNDGSLASYYKADILEDTLKLYVVGVTTKDEVEAFGTTAVKTYSCDSFTENKSTTDTDNIESWTAQFIIPVDEMGKLYIGYEDKASNKITRNDDAAIVDDSHYTVVFKGTASESVITNFFVSENIAPELDEVSIVSDNSYTFETDKYYSGDVVSTYSTCDTYSGINTVTVTEGGVSNDVYYASSINRETQSFVYESEKGTVKTGTTEVINNGAKAQGDDNLYNITLKTVDNSLNETEKSYKLYVDSLSPRVAPSRANTEAFVNVDKIETVFDVTDSHFFYSSAYGKVTAVVEYNGVNQTLEIGGAVHETSYDEAIKLEYTDSDTVKLTFTKEGKYQLKSLKVEDLLKNETDVDISAVDSAVVIDRNLADITDITFENASLKDKFFAVTHGTFSKDVVNVTVTVKNDGNLPSYYKADVVEDSFKLYVVEAADDSSVETEESTITSYACSSFKENKSSTDTKNIESWTVKFVLPLNTQGKLYIEFADKATNKLNRTDDAAIIDNAHNKVSFKGESTADAVDSNFFITETQAPSLDIVPGASTNSETADAIKAATASAELESYIDDDNNIWFDRNVIVPIQIQDTAGDGSSRVSGVYSVEIKVNGTNYEDTTLDSSLWEYKSGVHYYKMDENGGALNTSQHLFKVKTKEAAIGDNAEYKIEVKVVDYATNETSSELTIYKDTQSPDVVDFKFDPINKDETNDGNVTVVELDDQEKADGEGHIFGYYFKGDTKVTVTAIDRNAGKNKNTGVKTITFYTADYSDPKNVVVKKLGPKAVSAADAEGKCYAVFKVEANFKGQIFALATDNINNSYHTDLVTNNGKEVFERSFSIDGSVETVQVTVPRKTVLETLEHHNNEADHITYDVLNNTDYTDAKGYDLFSSTVKVKVTVKDVYAGLRSGEVVITSDENKTGEKNNYPFEVDNQGKVTGGWTVDKTEDNLVTQISKVITVKRDSNNIEFTTEMIDRAYNKTVKKLRKFSIDKTNPTVAVTYDNNSATEEKYFKETRTATIKVTERNFDPSLFNIMKNGQRVNVSWSSSGNYRTNTNKEGTVYTAKLPFSLDGDYTLSINGVDRARRKAAVTYTGTAPREFTIDLTDPVVKVTYSSDATAKNGNYYSRPRTATVEVNEHNWNADKFVFSLKMNDGSVQNPKLSWHSNGDIHTATFVADSVKGDKYTLDFECKDRADRDAVYNQNGKIVKDYAPEEFYVDQTNPEVRYNFNGADTGSDTSATTNNEFASSISISDTYYDYVNASIYGQAHNYHHNIRENRSTTIDIDSIIEAISEDDKVKDDFYTLNIEALDKAGNSTKIVRYFAVNRNGSIFTLGTAASKLVANKYTNNKKDLKNLKIKERNIDPILPEKSVLQLSVDGKVSTLKAGDDYTANYTNSRDYDGYYSVVYELNPSIFEKDALYKLLVTSKDAAGNTSKNSNKKGQDPAEDGPAILTFTHDETAPTIEINLDESMKNRWYSIAASEYLVEFTPIDTGSGINFETVSLSIGNGDKARTVLLGDEEYKFNYDKETNTYSFVLKGNNNDIVFNYSDNAGNEFEELIFKHITVSSNALERFFYNTPLFVGVLAGIVAAAAGVIIFAAKRRKKGSKEE